MVGYVRVSTSEQADSGLGLQAQLQALTRAAADRRWQLVSVEADPGVSAAARRRPGLRRALQLVRGGDADGLVVTRLDRLARSLLDFSHLMDESHRRGWRLVALDLGMDTATPAGGLVAAVMASFAEYERQLISLRTKEALAIARARGVQLGRTSTVPQPVIERIAAMRAQGLSYRAIAARLNAEGVPTSQPRKAGRPPTAWHAPSVQRMEQRARRAPAA